MTACALGGDAGAGRKIAASNHIAVPTPSFSESAGMLEKIKNLLGAKNTHLAAQLALLHSPEAASAGINPSMQQWLAQQIQERQWAFALRPDGTGYALAGQIAGKAFKLERGSPSREYVQGLELRLRCDLDVAPQTMLMLVNRHLRKSLDQNAYSAFADTMETLARRQLPEELLCMTLYGELTWEGLDERFNNDYCVLGDSLRLARAVFDDSLVQQLQGWPQRSITRPLVMMLMRGRLYLRMQFDDDWRYLAHALACVQTFANHVLAQQAWLAQAED